MFVVRTMSIDGRLGLVPYVRVSAGYNAWRDTKKPSLILGELCRTMNVSAPKYAANQRSVTVAEQRFECDPECVEFIKGNKSPSELMHRKVHQESRDEYLRENTALVALHGWGEHINEVRAERCGGGPSATRSVSF
jgi:hypothetical protein